jgi:hypothetical protein
MSGTGNKERAAEPLTALEWLRVTHAGTLSGRRIEEALAAAEARGRAEAAAKIGELAAEWRKGIHILDDIDRFEVVRALDVLAAELSAPGGPR